LLNLLRRLDDPMADAGNRAIGASVVGHRDRLFLIHLLTVVDPDKFREVTQ